MIVVLRSSIYANEDYDLYSVVEFSVRCAVERAIVFTWLICMNGTSQYHNYREFGSLQCCFVIQSQSTDLYTVHRVDMYVLIKLYIDICITGILFIHL